MRIADMIQAVATNRRLDIGSERTTRVVSCSYYRLRTHRLAQGKPFGKAVSSLLKIKSCNCRHGETDIGERAEYTGLPGDHLGETWNGSTGLKLDITSDPNPNPRFHADWKLLSFNCFSATG
jgi:hypothetical protein